MSLEQASTNILIDGVSYISEDGVEPNLEGVILRRGLDG